MSFTVEDVKKLKDLTGVGLTDARDALKEADGDFEKALEAMRKKGLTRAEKRAERETCAGVIDSYVHDGRIGVLVEVNCETDFVARTDEFKALAHEIALQIAAMSPVYLTLDEVPADEMERVKAEFLASDSVKGKSADIAERIIAGQIDKYFAEKTLMKQDYIKDGDKTIEALVKDAIAKLGENIAVKRFKRIEIGLED